MKLIRKMVVTKLAGKSMDILVQQLNGDHGVNVRLKNLTSSFIIFFSQAIIHVGMEEERDSELTWTTEKLLITDVQKI